MWKTCLSVAGVLVCAAALQAQQQPPAQPAPAADPKLEGHLQRWEQEMKAVQTLGAQVSRTTKDKTFQVNETYEGVARYMKPNLAALEMKKAGKADLFEKYICTGTYLYEFAPATKTVRVHELPQTQSGAVADDSFLSFLFGMKAGEASRRYDLKMAKEDQWYVYIEIAPKLQADKTDFSRARLVLSKQTYLPRQLWFEQPNGNEVTWDMPKMEANVKLERLEFTQPTVPQGWVLQRQPRATEVPAPNPAPNNANNNAPPRVIRQNQ